jgi:hypothetical protein
MASMPRKNKKESAKRAKRHFGRQNRDTELNRGINDQCIQGKAKTIDGSRDMTFLHAGINLDAKIEASDLQL